MYSLLSKLWADDKGAALAPELILIVVLTVIGIIPGLIALRNTENAALATLGNELLSIQTGFSFEPFTILGSGGNTVATVDGGFLSVTGATVLVSSSVGTTDSFAQTAVNPAP
jgi:hypothetical protein